MRRFAFVVLAQLAAVTTSHAGAPAVAHITEAADLGTFNGVDTVPTAINNRGELVGFVRNATGNTYDAFLWTPRFGYERIMTNPEGSFAYGINARGEVVGAAGKCEVTPTSTSCFYQGFVWSRSAGLRDLGSFIPLAINDRGDMAGVCPTGACVRRDGAVTPLVSNYEFQTRATGINARGDVVGEFEADFEWGPWIGLFWPREGGFIELGAGNPIDINKRGTIVGRLSEGQPEEEFEHSARIWTADGEISPPEADEAVSVNERGLVLLNIWGQHGLAWNPSTDARIILNSSLNGTTYAIDMNDRGEIVGLADSGAQDEHGLAIQHVVIWRLGKQDKKASRAQ